MWETVKNDKDNIGWKHLSVCTMNDWLRSLEERCVKRLSKAPSNRKCNYKYIE